MVSSPRDLIHRAVSPGSVSLIQEVRPGCNYHALSYGRTRGRPGTRTGESSRKSRKDTHCRAERTRIAESVLPSRKAKRTRNANLAPFKRIVCACSFNACISSKLRSSETWALHVLSTLSFLPRASGTYALHVRSTLSVLPCPTALQFLVLRGSTDRAKPRPPVAVRVHGCPPLWLDVPSET
jgi:hypothetical protein